MAFIVPVFIPHEGCPYSCVFCNQHQISGQKGEVITPAAVQETIIRWLSYRSPEGAGDEVQVAFYGGSFTGLSRSRQQGLLDAVVPFLDAGTVSSIRVSTRPDYIDPDRADFLAVNNVSLVELGVQSMDNRVLAAAGRGHDRDEVFSAVESLRRRGVDVGLQLMVGLPGQGSASLRHTVRQVIALRPDCVRIYPVLVVRGSQLEVMFRQGVYRPLSLSKAVIQVAYMKNRFDRYGIEVIRMGLQAGESLETALVAGPYHPSFGELVYGRLMLNQTRRLLAKHRNRNNITLVINTRDVSIFRGMRSANMVRLAELGLDGLFDLTTNPAQPRGRVSLAD